MNAIKKKDAERVLKANHFVQVRVKGSHHIYENQMTKKCIILAYNQGKSCCNGVIWQRLCKENNLR